MQDQCPRATAYVLSGNKDVTRHLRMKADQRFPLTIGGTDCRLVKYTVRFLNLPANIECQCAAVNWACLCHRCFRHCSSLPTDRNEAHESIEEQLPD